jgi:cellulose synthase operon protein YhjQ
MKIIAIASGKGGVGKTTLCANLSVALRKQGNSVLSIDMDPQNGLGLHFGIPQDTINGISRATLSSADWSAAICQSEAGDSVLPYGLIDDADRTTFERTLAEEPGLLQTQLQLLNLPIDSYVILDTPPGLSVYQQQAFSACHALMQVLCPDPACYLMASKYIEKIKKECACRPDFIGHMVSINKVDLSRQLDKDLMELMHESLASDYFSVIHQDPSIPEALAWGLTMLDYKTDCSGTRDITHTVNVLKKLMADAMAVH